MYIHKILMYTNPQGGSIHQLIMVPDCWIVGINLIFKICHFLKHPPC